MSTFTRTSGQSRCRPRRTRATAGRNGFRDTFHVLFDLVHLRMHFPNEVMLDLGKPFDAPGHFVQLFQHGVLTRRDAVHPPKTNAPATETDPRKRKENHVTARALLRSRY